jgi:hypothetical protein
MGQIAEDTLNGLSCEKCGCWMPDVEKWIDRKVVDQETIKRESPFLNPPGHPRTCEDCIKEEG